jgi:hypothetical protein
MIEDLTSAELEAALRAAAALWTAAGDEDPRHVLSPAERAARDRVARLRRVQDGGPADGDPVPGTDAARGFVQAVAANAMVGGDFDDAHAAFNGLVADARALAEQLGIGYQAAQDTELTDPWVSPVPDPWGRPSEITGL